MPEPLPFSVVGRWSLVSIETDEENLPGHRVDFDFREGAQGLHGVVLNRFAGAEIPLQTLTFDGETLRLQMSPPPGRQMDPLPFLVMTRVGDRFEGRWDMSVAAHLKLKLVRTRMPDRAMPDAPVSI
jgi:hypothetical protein